MASKMAQERPKRGPRGPQDGPKSAQESPKSAPRGPEESPKRVQEASNMSSRGPYDGPKKITRRPQLSILHFARRAVLGWAGGDSQSVNNWVQLVAIDETVDSALTRNRNTPYRVECDQAD